MSTQATGLFARLKNAIPPARDLWAGAIIWSLAMLAAVMAGQWYFFRGVYGKEHVLSAVYFLGGLFAWPFALYLARFTALARTMPIRLIAAPASLTACTLAMTGFIFSQQFQMQFSDTHLPIHTRIGMHQYLETSASGVYQFLVVGLRLYFPIGILALLPASLWLARRMR